MATFLGLTLEVWSVKRKMGLLSVNFSVKICGEHWNIHFPSCELSEKQVPKKLTNLMAIAHQNHSN